jgi:hypothetical protein
LNEKENRFIQMKEKKEMNKTTILLLMVLFVMLKRVFP